jgi:hypothetical protein
LVSSELLNFNLNIILWRLTLKEVFSIIKRPKNSIYQNWIDRNLISIDQLLVDQNCTDKKVIKIWSITTGLKND